MALVPMKTLLDKAYREGYALGAFNIVDLTFLEAIIDAARAQKSPVILNVAEVHFPFVTIEHIVPALQQIAREEKFDIALNLDHGLDIAAIERAVACGFGSVMFDGSHLDYEENIRQTREVLNLCRPKNISVEAELGAVGGGEGGALCGSADPAKFTDAAQAEEFVKRTGIDALAVAIGNSHGRYRGEPKLDFDRLRDIRERCGIPLVLHGGSGIPDDDFRKAISMGIAKINFFTGMSQAALAAASSALAGQSEGYNDYPAMIASVRRDVAAVVSRQMMVFGSSGRA